MVFELRIDVLNEYKFYNWIINMLEFFNCKFIQEYRLNIT